MLKLKLIVVLISLRSEAYLLDFLLYLLLLHFLLTAFLLVEELREVDETADRRLGVGGYLHQINSLTARHIQRFTCWHHLGAIVAYDTHLLGTYVLISAILIL